MTRPVTVEDLDALAAKLARPSSAPGWVKWVGGVLGVLAVVGGFVMSYVLVSRPEADAAHARLDKEKADLDDVETLAKTLGDLQNNQKHLVEAVSRINATLDAHRTADGHPVMRERVRQLEHRQRRDSR